MHVALVSLAAVLLATAAASQGGTRPGAAGLGIVGTWELTAAANVPYESELVFGRIAFTPDEMRSVFVFRDPDDAELEGRVYTDRYIVSDGQLIVRDGPSTTLLDVLRDGPELTVRDVQTGVLFQMREADPARALDPALVGAWRGQLGKEVTTLTFSPSGEVRLEEADGDTDERAYTVGGPYLLLGERPFLYTVADDGQRLILENLGEQQDFLRVSR